MVYKKLWFLYQFMYIFRIFSFSFILFGAPWWMSVFFHNINNNIIMHSYYLSLRANIMDDVIRVIVGYDDDRIYNILNPL